MDGLDVAGSAGLAPDDHTGTSYTTDPGAFARILTEADDDPTAVGNQPPSAFSPETSGATPADPAHSGEHVSGQNIQLAQAMPLPVPGMPPILFPPSATPQMPTAAQWRTAIDRAGRRLDYVGKEIGRGDVGSAAGHLLLARPFPPEVDDPPLADPYGKRPPGLQPAPQGPGPAAGTVMEKAATPIAAAALPAAAAAARSEARVHGCNLAFVVEPSEHAKGTPWRDYEDQTPGRLTDPATGNPIVPVLEYTNTKPSGAPYVKFDGFQPVPGGGIQVIDSKLSVPSWLQNGRMTVPPKVEDQLKRQSQALAQNLGCPGIINVPNAAEQAKAEEAIESLNIKNLLVVVRSYVP